MMEELDPPTISLVKVEPSLRLKFESVRFTFPSDETLPVAFTVLLMKLTEESLSPTLTDEPLVAVRLTSFAETPSPNEIDEFFTAETAEPFSLVIEILGAAIVAELVPVVTLFK